MFHSWADRNTMAALMQYSKMLRSTAALWFIMTIEMNVRPHPGPLPQERENRSPSLCVAEAFGSSFALRFENPMRGDRWFDSRKICIVQSVFPLPGERARVRASVKTNFT